MALYNIELFNSVTITGPELTTLTPGSGGGLFGAIPTIVEEGNASAIGASTITFTAPPFTRTINDQAAGGDPGSEFTFDDLNFGTDDAGVNETTQGQNITTNQMSPEFTYVMRLVGDPDPSNVLYLTAVFTIEGFSRTFSGYIVHTTPDAMTPVPGGVPLNQAYEIIAIQSNTPSLNAVCFARGTKIQTPTGPILVENLSIGGLVLTVDEGPQPIRWIGSRLFSQTDLVVNPKLRPILIRKDALGDELPQQDLVVSRQHRILLCNAIAQRMFGTSEILVPAISLLEFDGVDLLQNTPDGVEYFHILFDKHQLVWSNGLPAESLFTGPEALRSIAPEAREEIATMFPDICAPGYAPVPVRMIPGKRKRVNRLVDRIKCNKKMPLELAGTTVAQGQSPGL